jgi:microcystin-dependent protein
MAESYIGEIRMFGGNFAPSGWAFCGGQLLQISENEALFSLLGTTYGGDGQMTFAVPDLRGRLPMHQNNVNPLGLMAGVESVTLLPTQIPAHTHALSIATAASATSPSGQMLANPGGEVFIATTPNAPLSPQAIGSVGSNQSHENMQPYLCVNFIISLFGTYPSQS